MVLRVKEAVFLLVELVKAPSDERRSAEMKGAPQFLLDSALQFLLSCFLREEAKVFTGSVNGT